MDLRSSKPVPCLMKAPKIPVVCRKKKDDSSKQEASSNKCHATRNRCLTSSYKKL